MKETPVKNLEEFIEEKDKEELVELTDQIHDFLLDLRNNPQEAIKELEEREKNLNEFELNHNLKSVLISLITKFISTI